MKKTDVAERPQASDTSVYFLTSPLALLSCQAAIYLVTRNIDSLPGKGLLSLRPCITHSTACPVEDKRRKVVITAFQDHFMRSALCASIISTISVTDALCTTMALIIT